MTDQPMPGSVQDAAAAVTPLAPLNSDSPTRPNRLDLARWLVSPDQPLTPRVTANRFCRK